MRTQGPVNPLPGSSSGGDGEDKGGLDRVLNLFSSTGILLDSCGDSPAVENWRTPPLFDLLPLTYLPL